MPRLSAQEMLLCLIPRVTPELFDLREERFVYCLSFPLVVMLVGVLRARLRENDGERINVQLKCNLDREDCTSLRSPFTLPYA